MSKALIIVESPAKAKTIASYLGDGYTVESSIGHIRDLPSKASEIPAPYRSESWARLGIDVENDFKPLYIVPSNKKQQIKKLKDLLQDADELYLATDEDREGEAIAWHLLEVLSPRAAVAVKRMVFHEITPAAIQAAIRSPRELDRRLVDAQEARRLLDRLYGYEVSPVLWKKVLPKLSAGRVQSVATRIIVERERQRIEFNNAEYWSLSGEFFAIQPGQSDDPQKFSASLSAVDGSKVATGKDFDSQGQLNEKNLVYLDEQLARSLAQSLQGQTLEVRNVEVKPYRRRPAPPFMTSTFQQAAGRKLHISAVMAMRTAQSLYEKGYITYMRTDSTTLSVSALDAARAAVLARFSQEYLPEAPRTYTNKVKNAQEAHEAIRPSGEQFRTPEDVSTEVAPLEAQVYELIWQRTLASQMTDRIGETVHVDFGGSTKDGHDVTFGASGTVITHEGFRQVYKESTDEETDSTSRPQTAQNTDEAAERQMPALAPKDKLGVATLTPEGHSTQPPARFTEASLVRRLEELGVGRPSTYAAIINTIVDRGYVWKNRSALVPSFTAFAVINLLEKHFPNLVNYAFTAQMEDDLDAIAAGEREAIPWLSRFYFGPNQNDPTDSTAHGVAKFGLRMAVSERLADIDARAVNTFLLGEDNGQAVEARVGRYGPYVQRGEDRASLPEDLPPDELTIEKALALITAPTQDRTLGEDPETGLEVFVRNGRFGPYVQLGEDSDTNKPKRASLFASMSVEQISLNEALQLLSLPRIVGKDPADDEDILAQNGRYGPYITKGSETRSLDSEDQIFDVTLQECLGLLAQPRRRRGQPAKPPLREVGQDPATEKPMIIKDGRFGPYVTDGEVNASLGKGDAVETISVQRAAELLQNRRDKLAANGGKTATRRKSPGGSKSSTRKKSQTKTSPSKRSSTKNPDQPLA